MTDQGTLEVNGRRYPVLAIAGPGEQPIELLIADMGGRCGVVRRRK